MTPLHTQAAVLLAVLPAITALVPSGGASIQHIQSVRNNNHLRKIGNTKLSLGIDPTDIIVAHAAASHYDHTSTFDFLTSSMTLAKASSVVPPNSSQSLAPLTETIQTGQNMIDTITIPDMPQMPGGVPRTGNAFLSDSFRELYNGSLKTTPNSGWNSALQLNDDGTTTLVVPARELDVVARYADLLNRIPLAAAVYALVDFFLINAEEDFAIAELLLDEDEEVEALMAVERKVMMQRFVGLFMVVAVTVGWSFLSYHPVPFNEL